MTDFKTPFLWSGSKDKNWKVIQQYVPVDLRNYVEPFVGGGSIYFRLLGLRPSFPCHIADVNDELRNCYEQIRDNQKYIVENLPLKKDKAIFKLWQSDKASISKEERAMRFLYMNRNRFFGLGGWMTADRYARGAVIDRVEFFSPRMNNTVVYKDAFDVPIHKDDFVFCDPPYPETNNKACYKVDDDEILKLNVDYLKKVVDSKARFLFITKNVPEINALATKLKIPFEIKRWVFRKPQKDPVVSEEIYISNTQPVSFFEECS